VRSIDPDNRSCRARLRACPAAAFAAVRSRLRSERGSVLVEVLIGSVVVAIATVGVLNGLDGAQQAGAANKARSVKSTLAQQDIERMRSIPITALSNLNQTRPVAVAGVTYTVVSTTQWVSDKNGVVNCSDTNAQADYLKLTSTVTSPGTTSKPVVETGLLTPTVGQLSASSGSATVKLVDRVGAPIAGVSVVLTGASSKSATTNALGCAVFGYIPSGTYTATVNGYVEMDSVPPANEPLVVYPGRASFGQMLVDRPASIRATFVAPGTSPSWPTPMQWDRITVKNANLVGASKLFVRTAGANTSVDATNLFPFTDGVGVYAGDCPANDPSIYSTNYFNASATRGYTILAPNDNFRALNVEMPTLRVNVARQAISSVIPSWTRTQLMVTENDAAAAATGCTDVIYQLTNTRTAAQTPVPMDFAAPFGHYTICASTRGRTSGTSGTTGQTVVDRKITATVDMTIVPGTNNRQMTMTTTAATSGFCFP
jgi:Tfp pilus assembly protein PilV